MKSHGFLPDKGSITTIIESFSAVPMKSAFYIANTLNLTFSFLKSGYNDI